MAEDDTAPWDSDQTYLKVTLKANGEYKDSWVNIGAAKPGDLRRALVQFFGWDEAETAELTLAQLSFNATQEWRHMNTVGSFEGARAIPDHSQGARAAYAAAQAQTPAPDPKQVLLAEVAAQTSVVDLKTLYAKNKESFDSDAELLAAYKAKGKALSK